MSGVVMGIKRKRIARNLVLVGDLVKCRIKRGRKYHEWTAPVQGKLAYSTAADGTLKPTAKLTRWLAEIEAAVDDRRFDALRQTHIRRRGLTIGELLAAYRDAAEARRTSFGVPAERSQRLVESRLLLVARGCGLGERDLVEQLTPDAIAQWVERRVAKRAAAGTPRERALATAVATLRSARDICSRWAMDYYRRSGIDVPPCILEWPHFKSKHSPQWEDPPKALKDRLLAEARKLRADNPAVWVLYHVLISFGCRPVDALALRMEDFEMLPGADGSKRRCLVYTPRKTRNSSGRRVVVPVADRVWQELAEGRKAAGCGPGGLLVPSVPGHRGREQVLEDLNAWMRSIGWKQEDYHYAAYNLRKLFTSAVLTEHGEQIASDLCGSSVAMVRRSYGAFFHERLPTVDVSSVICR